MNEIVRVRPAAATRRRVAIKRRRPKRVAWSARRERLFLETLAQTACVAAAARASGLSDTNVYRRRRKDEAFRARWVEALREGYATLETMLLERAINGVEKAVWHGGKQVGTAREYSDRLALALLAAHRGTVTGAAHAHPPAMSDEAVTAELLARLDAMHARLGDEPEA